MRNKVLLVLLIVSIIPCRARSADDTFAAMKKLLASKNRRVAVSIRDREGNEVFNFQGDTLLAPASIAKTVSTACSLDVLGPQYQFDTLFLMSGKIQGDTLEGDLIVQGKGDPGLVIEDMHEVIEKLRFMHGIKKITGNLVFDNSYLGQKSLSMGEGFEGDEGRSFTAEITPTAINQNSFSVWVTPDLRETGKTRAVSLPAGVMDLKLTNKSKVGSSNGVSLNYDVGQMSATVSGVMTKDAAPKGIYRAVDDAYTYALNIMHRLWVDSGGEWKDPKIKIVTSPLAGTLLWKNQSRPLAKLLMDVNKFSLNIGAEMIFLAAGGEKYGLPATYDKSLKMLAECLKEKGIEAGGLDLTNGSGLSRETRFKVSALTRFLNNYAGAVYAPEYQSSFGLLGIDGTVKMRMKNYVGRARLKTGSLKDVSSIAGYLYSSDHKSYSFAMIQNSIAPSEAKGLEDQVIEDFLKHH